MSTREQKVNKHKNEIRKLKELNGLNDILDTSEKNTYTFSQLEGQKRQLITVLILNSYLQIDAKMSILVANFFFHHCSKEWEVVQKVVNSKEFLVFSKKLLNEMPFLRKVSVIKEFVVIPKDTLTTINKLNDLRNAIAHSLMPEQLGEERVKYKGKLIFTLTGAKLIKQDVGKVMSFLQKNFVKAFDDNRNS